MYQLLHYVKGGSLPGLKKSFTRYADFNVHIHPISILEAPMALCGGDHRKLIARINRSEGQVRGLKKMVEDDRDCLQVLKQIAAAGGALRSLGAVILEEHLKGCVA
jgi:DNA-binding FrmR family transcriptional regulator